MNPLIQLKTTPPLLITLALLCLGLLPQAQAVNPPPDGGYAGQNTAEGTDALFSLTSGVWNVAVGFEALFNDTSGNQNTATGYKALFSNTTGDKSTAYGSQALFSNTTGNDNVATGFGTLYTNTTGNRNTGMGYRTLTFNNGDDNTAIGWNALYNNTTGIQNTAIGSQALLHGSGRGNTAIGYTALTSNTTTSANTAIGHNALNSITNDGDTNTAVGAGALSALGSFPHDPRGGSGNIGIGASTGRCLAVGSDNIYIGNAGPCGQGNPPEENGVIRIGEQQSTAFIAGIYGASVPAATAVYIDSSGQLGTVASALRFKKDIATMEKVSEAILSLRPVTFHYKTDTKDTPQFGLIAEEVAKVNPALVLPDKEGKPYTVRYDQVNAMLLNEFLKEHKTVQDQGATIAELKKEIAALAAGLQKVTAQLEASKSAPQVVNNP